MGSGRQNTYDCVLGGRAEGRLFQGRGGVGWEQGGEVRWGGGGWVGVGGVPGGGGRGRQEEVGGW